MIIVDTMVIIDLWRERKSAEKSLRKNKEDVFDISAISIEEIYN